MQHGDRRFGASMHVIVAAGTTIVATGGLGEGLDTV